MYAALNPQKDTVFAFLPTAEGQLQTALYRISGELVAGLPARYRSAALQRPPHPRRVVA